MRNKFFTSETALPGKRIHYTEWGRADNPDLVVCAHGLTRNGRDFDLLAQSLAEKFRVLCPDMPGRGESDWLADASQYNYSSYTQLTLEWLQSPQLSSRQRLQWVGTSLGGIIGMCLFASQPTSLIDRLVLNDVGFSVAKQALARLATYVGVQMTFPSLVAWEQHLRVVAKGFGPLSDAQWQHLALHSCRIQRDGSVCAAYDPAIGIPLRGLLEDVDLTPLWQAVRCPVLLLRGEHSDLLSRAMAEQMSSKASVQLLEIADTGHAPMLMRDDEIAWVRAFLQTGEVS